MNLEIINNKDSINNKKRNTAIPNIINMDKLIGNKKNTFLADALTNKEKFLRNEYNNPLLFSLGLGIVNLAFVDNNKNKFKSFSNKKKLNEVTAINEVDEKENDDIILSN